MFKIKGKGLLRISEFGKFGGGLSKCGYTASEPQP